MHKPRRDWQQSLSEAFHNPLDLLRALELEAGQLPYLDRHELNFPMRVPRAFAQRMRAGDPQDPLLLQVLPLRQEAADMPGFVADPLQERESRPAAGIVHKYAGRALLICTQACGVHCRYCFRREFPYADSRSSAWREALDWLQEQSDISEIILSGGDPLSLSDEKLADLLRQLQAIPHLKRIRFHSRQPIVLPERITPAALG